VRATVHICNEYLVGMTDFFEVNDTLHCLFVLGIAV
jgi:hypothetical protein